MSNFDSAYYNLKMKTVLITKSQIKYSLVMVALIFAGCSDNAEKVKPVTETKMTKYSQIEKLFKDVASDTFYVFSDWEIQNPKYLFKGTTMDSIQISLLPYELKNKYTWTRDIAACYKFPIDASRIALIARLPGEYESTAIKLLVFDLEKDSVVETIHLSDVFGDAGEVYTYRSCLFKDKEKKPLILTYSYSSYDHGVNGDSTDTAVETWNNYYLTSLLKTPADTISKDSATIVTQHPEIIKKLTSN